jgi:hypothetical protein
VTSGTVFFKLSKLLHQEDALSVPCFRLMSDSRLGSPGHHLDDAFLVVGQMHGQSGPVQGQAGLSWQDSAEM